MATIKAIIFDVGGVLMVGQDIVTKIPSKNNKGIPDYQIRGINEAMARAFNISIDEWFDAMDTAYPNSIVGKVSKTEMLRVISKNIGVSSDKLEMVWKKYIKKYFSKNRKLLRVIKRLKESLGVKTAILSDQFWISDEVLIKDSGIEKFFDHVFVSNRDGLRKPDKKYYSFVLKKLKVKPSEVVFVDNRSWNIIPAKKLGMNTILFKDNNSCIKELLKFLGGNK